MNGLKPNLLIHLPTAKLMYNPFEVNNFHLLNIVDFGQGFILTCTSNYVKLRL